MTNDASAPIELYNLKRQLIEYNNRETGIKITAIYWASREDDY